MRPQLLVPAATPKLLKTALENGADGGYAPVNDMCSVRFKPQHFNKESIREILDYANGLNKKVYPVLNALVTDNQLADFNAMVEFCLDAGAPGIVLGDWGLIKHWGARLAGSDVELIASSMAGPTSAAAASFLKELGAARVILPRLQTLSEIEHIVNSEPDIAYEVFMNGAVCPLYEGRGCYLRSVFSGYQRGVCLIYPEELQKVKHEGQTFWGLDSYPLFAVKPKNPVAPCALRLDLKKAGEPLSSHVMWQPLLQSNLKYLSGIMRLGISALKLIPFSPTTEVYAAQTSLWRRLIDNILDGREMVVTVKDLAANSGSLTVDYELIVRQERG